MTAPVVAERHPLAVDPAARRPLGDISAGAERFTEHRVERILSLMVALGCAVLGTQAFVAAFRSLQEAAAWHVPLMVLAFAPLALMIVALAAGVWVRAASRLCAVALVAVQVCWPIATAGVAVDATEPAWVWYLLNVATVAAVMGFRLPLQIAWAVLVPVLYLVGRLVQIGGAPDAVVSVALDAAFALILAGVIITLGWMFRTVARGIDAARRAAVDSYAEAAAVDAIETERVEVAALMHDSVLAALIAAERATSPREAALAAAMSREALTRLANAEQDAGEGSDAPVDAASIISEIERAAADLGAQPRVVRRLGESAGPIPGRVARAIVLAATQAIANAVQHAGDVALVVVADADADAVRVRVADGGAGFDPDGVGDDRLGIRGSIVARMAAAGGRARVQTGSTGTTVTLEWERTR